MTLLDRCIALAENLGLGEANDVLNVTPLTGRVASDIARVDRKGRSLCASFALPKLEGAADWFAPVSRDLAEYAWLQVAADVEPIGAVQLYGR